ncbi:MAG: hypothetical protein ACAI35_06915 [Candidatus Methylacidiphilales bacterium]|nr:hypothetical protein [Candidatus Methylacidiphilales bacterium]
MNSEHSYGAHVNSTPHRHHHRVVSRAKVVDAPMLRWIWAARRAVTRFADSVKNALR